MLAIYKSLIDRKEYFYVILDDCIEIYPVRTRKLPYTAQPVVKFAKEK